MTAPRIGSAGAEAKAWLRLAAKELAPVGLVNILRERRNKGRSKGTAATPTEASVFRAQLEGLGIRPGRDLFIHSSLRAIGKVEGGAEAIIAMLRELAGPESTLLMPAYPVIGSTRDWLTSPTPFDLATSPSTMGALSEVFRRQEGAARSGHPTHSVAAFGPKAEAYVAAHHEMVHPCDRNSPFELLLRGGGDILALGSGVGNVTAYHVIEALEPHAFPVRFREGEVHEKPVRRLDGAEVTGRAGLSRTMVSAWRVDNFAPVEAAWEGHLDDFDAVTRGPLGRGQGHLIDGPRFVEMMQTLRDRNITIYHRPRLNMRPGVLVPDFVR